MKKVLVKTGGLILFYGVVALGIVLINIRFNYLNSNISDNQVIYAFNN